MNTDSYRQMTPAHTSHTGNDHSNIATFTGEAELWPAVLIACNL